MLPQLQHFYNTCYLHMFIIYIYNIFFSISSVFKISPANTPWQVCVQPPCSVIYKTLQNRRFRFPRNAQAVLNVPWLLIVQRRKHRRFRRPSVWNGRNCFLGHGSTATRLLRYILRWPWFASVRGGNRESIRNGIKDLLFYFFNSNWEKPEKRPGWLRSQAEDWLRVNTAGISRRDGWATRMRLYSSVLGHVWPGFVYTWGLGRRCPTG